MNYDFGIYFSFNNLIQMFIVRAKNEKLAIELFKEVTKLTDDDICMVRTAHTCTFY